jgi:hypothetical protein
LTVPQVSSSKLLGAYHCKESYRNIMQQLIHHEEENQHELIQMNTKCTFLFLSPDSCVLNIVCGGGPLASVIYKVSG